MKEQYSTMVDFIMDQKEHEAKTNPTGVSECLIDPQQCIVSMGLGQVDNCDELSLLSASSAAWERTFTEHSIVNIVPQSKYHSQCVL
jgi:hypothetical protein